MLRFVHREKDIDPSILLDAACGDRDLMTELLELFFDLTGQELDRLIGAVEAGDAESVSEAAHKIVGSSAACGFVGLASDLRELEQRSKQGLPADTDERIQRIKVQLEQARMFFENHIKGGFQE